MDVAQIWVPNKTLSKDGCVTATLEVIVRFTYRGPNMYMPTNVSSFLSPSSTLQPSSSSTLSSSLLCCQMGRKFKIMCNKNSWKREEIEKIGRSSSEFSAAPPLFRYHRLGAEHGQETKKLAWSMARELCLARTLLFQHICDCHITSICRMED